MVIELKRGKAPDRVVAHVDRYLEWVERNLARPEQGVHGLIIARAPDQRLSHTLARRSNVDLYIYEWQLKLVRWESQQEAQRPEAEERVNEPKPQED